MENSSSGGNMGWDRTRGTISRQFDWTQTSPSVAAIRLVSLAMNCDPMSVQPLGETVDTDALDQLLVSMDDDDSISFCHSDLSVHMHGDGRASVSHEGE